MKKVGFSLFSTRKFEIYTWICIVFQFITAGLLMNTFAIDLGTLVFLFLASSLIGVLILRYGFNFRIINKQIRETSLLEIVQKLLFYLFAIWFFFSYLLVLPYLLINTYCASKDIHYEDCKIITRSSSEPEYSVRYTVKLQGFNRQFNGSEWLDFQERKFEYTKATQIRVFYKKAYFQGYFITYYEFLE